MGASYKATCIILKKTKLGETDLILTMLDSAGRQVRGVAKGARKPGNKRFGARVEPFSVVDMVMYPGRSLESITDVRCVEPNAHCREDLDRSSACSIMTELVDKVTSDGEVGERVFACLKAALHTIDGQPAEDALLIALAFCLKAVAMMGLRPALHECALCGTPVGAEDVFDMYAGGRLCSDCAAGSAGNVDPLVATWLDLMLGSTFAELAEVAGAPGMRLLDVVEGWIREHLGLRLKSVSFVRATL